MSVSANEQTPKPQIIIDPGVEPDVKKRIASISRAMESKPVSFLAAIGEVSLGDSLPLDALGERVPLATRTPKKLLEELFKNRYDLEFEYDEVTESALSADQTFKGLKTAVQARGNTIDRDQLRRYRVDFFLRRLTDWRLVGNEAEQDQSTLAAS